MWSALGDLSCGVSDCAVESVATLSHQSVLCPSGCPVLGGTVFPAVWVQQKPGQARGTPGGVRSTAPNPCDLAETRLCCRAGAAGAWSCNSQWTPTAQFSGEAKRSLLSSLKTSSVIISACSFHVVPDRLVRGNHQDCLRILQLS